MPPDPNVKARMLTLTPKIAEQLLERNRHNRSVSRPRVQQYAADMRDGNWAFNGGANPEKFPKIHGLAASEAHQPQEVAHAA